MGSLEPSIDHEVHCISIYSGLSSCEFHLWSKLLDDKKKIQGFIQYLESHIQKSQWKDAK